MNENGWAKISRKLKEEPLIPLGISLSTLPPSHLAFPQPTHPEPLKKPSRTPANPGPSPQAAPSPSPP